MIFLAVACLLYRGELDMNMHVPDRIHSREISQMILRSRDHLLFLHVAGNFYKICAQAWLDRGAGASKGTPWEPLKSALRRAEQAQGDEDLFSILSIPAEEWCPFGKQPSCCFSIPKVVSQRRDIFPFPSSGRLGRMIAVLLRLPRP